jgi:hypothetical protein
MLCAMRQADDSDIWFAMLTGCDKMTTAIEAMISGAKDLGRGMDIKLLLLDVLFLLSL